MGGSEAVPGTPVTPNPATGHTEPVSGNDQHEDQHEEDGQQPSRREAKYRQQLRATEQERDGLRQRVEVMQRREVEQLAAASLEDSEDFWVGASLTDVLDDAGDVDPALVAEKISELVRNRPHWAKQAPPARIPLSTLKSGASNPGEMTSDVSWASVLRPES